MAGAQPTSAPNSASARQQGSASAANAAGAPRTRSQTLAARQQGMSMSSLLQTRSEAAVTAKKAAAPASPLPDIDSADRMNPLAATEYVNDIYSYYRRIEPRFRVAPDYMTKQVPVRTCLFVCSHAPLHAWHPPEPVPPTLDCRLTSTRRCVPSWLTGWWRCTSSSRWVASLSFSDAPSQTCISISVGMHNPLSRVLPQMPVLTFCS